MSASPVPTEHDSAPPSPEQQHQHQHHQPVVDGPPPGPGATGLRGTLMPAVIVLAIGAIFVSVYLAAFHAPKPHHLPVSVVGSSAQVQAVRGALDAAEPGGFSVRTYPSRAAAVDSLDHRTTYGAVIAADPQAGGRPTVLYAGANGTGAASAVTGALGAAGASALAQHAPLAATDVLPSAAGDSRGLSIFYGAFGLVLAGFLFGSMTYQSAPRLTYRLRMTSLALFSVVAGVALPVIAGNGYGALPGSFWPLFLVTALMAAASAATTMALLRLLGPLGISLASVLVLIFGNATSGGVLPTGFLPGWMHPLASILPVGVSVRGLQGIAYFHDDGLGIGIGVLVAWLVVALGVIYLRDVHQPKRRSAKN